MAASGRLSSLVVYMGTIIMRRVPQLIFNQCSMEECWCATTRLESKLLCFIIRFGSLIRQPTTCEQMPPCVPATNHTLFGCTGFSNYAVPTGLFGVDRGAV